MSVTWGKAEVTVTAGDKTISTWITRAKRQERGELFLGIASTLLMVAIIIACTTLTIAWA
jgi:small neutral amino acid transporter SnatA (MarC family)